MNSFIASVASLAVAASLLSQQVYSACASQENELTSLLCEVNGAHDINDMVRSVCLCPLEIDDKANYEMFSETVRPNAIQIVKNSAQHSSLLPIPEYVINDEVRRFVAGKDAITYQFSNGDYEQLVIEGGQPLLPREQELREKFHDWIYSRGYLIPEGFVEGMMDMRTLATHGKNFEESYYAMIEHEKHMLEVQQPLFARISQLDSVNMGIFYGYMRDKQMRPINIFNIRRSIDAGLTEMDDFLDAIDSLMTYSQYHALVPGQIEVFTTILDFKDVPLYEFPVGQLLHMTKRMKAGYKLRSFKITCVNVHWLLNAAAQVVFTFLPTHVGEKVSLLTSNGSKELLQIIDADHLEKKYGGTLPNKEDEFFPPRYNP